MTLSKVMICSGLRSKGAEASHKQTRGNKSGAHSSYDEPIGSGGNREDLGDVLFDVSPTK